MPAFLTAHFYDLAEPELWVGIGLLIFIGICLFVGVPKLVGGGQHILGLGFGGVP